MTAVEVGRLSAGTRVMWGMREKRLVHIEQPKLAGPEHRDLVLDDVSTGERMVQRVRVTDPIQLAPTPIDKGEMLEAVRWRQDPARVDFDNDEGTSIVGAQVHRRGDAWVVEIIQYQDVDLLVQIKEAW